MNDDWLRKDVILSELCENIVSYLETQVETVTESLDLLIQGVVDRITIYDKMLAVEFKYGLEIELDT